MLYNVALEFSVFDSSEFYILVVSNLNRIFAQTARHVELHWMIQSLVVYCYPLKKHFERLIEYFIVSSHVDQTRCYDIVCLTVLA